MHGVEERSDGLMEKMVALNETVEKLRAENAKKFDEASKQQVAIKEIFDEASKQTSESLLRLSHQ